MAVASTNMPVYVDYEVFSNGEYISNKESKRTKVTLNLTLDVEEYKKGYISYS